MILQSQIKNSNFQKILGIHHDMTSYVTVTSYHDGSTLI